MDYEPIDRSPGEFQQPLTEAEIAAVTRTAFGAGVTVRSADELAGGYYNNTYRIDLGSDRPVVLRVSPEPARQARADPEMMRNEHATIPYLAPIAGLLPRTLAIDFTHQVIGRDYLFQTFLAGVPAGEKLTTYPEPVRGTFFRQLGDITRTVHSVPGPAFGRVAGPAHERWSDALFTWFDHAAADLSDAGLDASDIMRLVEVADRNRTVLDEVTEPRLLHGDLWVGNTMLAEAAPEPMITGVFDCDRTWWGDPEADWPIYLALRKPGTERDAFWESYGQAGRTESARWRALVYEAKHATALLLEYHRFAMHTELAQTHGEIRDLTTRLATGY
ncbi:MULTISPECIES: aminoglycoside phosphotransferase family protein [unclassified Streptomyces]|uniref:phosphotransferase family protein n=1 Tax=unclassified Streptomyces TaxID=2593676 RepID=UPI00036BB977|nr:MULTISPECIES: aminoglycoside phosphotransferase family protein [unclassified Streptomyces]MYY04546.1 phosphotransferase [Streptomyces sp. SID4913]